MTDERLALAEENRRKSGLEIVRILTGEVDGTFVSAFVRATKPRTSSSSD
jgi:hypothetical protein